MPKSGRLVLSLVAGATLSSHVLAQAPIEIGFLWHMHQPIYYPGENIVQTQNAGRYSFSLYDVHNQRFGPYTTWPRNAVQSGQSLPNLGTQVSFSGSLIENINRLRNANVNGGMWNNWQGAYQQARSWNTVQGNTRMDMIGFTYHHGLGPLLDTRDLRMQIQMHRLATQQTFGGAYSKGFFPAETAFSTRMIPALVAEGFEWTLFDSIHLDRAMQTYPHTNASNLYAPNKADQINPAPTAWVQLNNLWAPSRVGAPESYRPAYVQHVDPNTGEITRIVGVPAARYEGNEDGRGGFGALQYQSVMDQYRQYNTNPNRPMFVVLHHDGDNYGGGSEAYYHGNFQNMVNWDASNPNYNVSTVQDYLERFPVPQNAVIHVEPGSWAGADNGDPEFKKWLADPNPAGWSPDRNSWAVLTAAKNRVYTAEDLIGRANPQNVINNTGTAAERGWHYLTQAQASDHWYWDGTEIWDSNVTRGSNLATQMVDATLASLASNETTPPNVFLPQRDTYNPGEIEWGPNPESADFRIWTYAYDVSGLSSVTLKFRVDADGTNPLGSTQNETYTGGPEVSLWQSIPMLEQIEGARPANILGAVHRARQYGAMVTGQRNVLLDYYVEAVDARGNITRSDIQHVWVGNGSGNPDPDPDPDPDPGPANGFTMDGVLDAGVELVADNGMRLHFALEGSTLYVATQDAGEGSDHFIFVAREPGVMRPAPWAKAGQVAQWHTFLADENNNDYEGWFDAQASAQAMTGPNGGVLEGTLDLVDEFGDIPEAVHLAVGIFGNNDGGTLLSSHQVPPSLDGDGNIEANEYVRVSLAHLPQWDADTSGNWSQNTNWSFDRIPHGAGRRVNFNAVNSASRTITLDQDVTLGRLRFDSPNPYVIEGANTITLDEGPRRIEVVRGHHQINASIQLTGASTLDVASGTSILLGSMLEADHALIKQGDGVLSATTLRLASLDIDAGAVRLPTTELALTSVIDALSVDVAAIFDLGRARVVIDDNTAATMQSIRAMVLDGRIVGSPGLTVALADNAVLGLGSFGDAGIDPTSLLLRATLAGDADLDGEVDFGDLLALAQAYESTGGWAQGDFDYDGTISFADLLALAQNYGSAMLDSTPTRVLDIGQFEVDRAMAFSMVPEPAALGLIGAAMLLGLRRRG